MERFSALLENIRWREACCPTSCDAVLRPRPRSWCTIARNLVRVLAQRKNQSNEDHGCLAAISQWDCAPGLHTVAAPRLHRSVGYQFKLGS